MWQPIVSAPKDGTEVALLFQSPDDVMGKTVPRVRAAAWTPGGWGLPYYTNNPPIAWHPLPSAPDENRA
jgi:hypothetical protein